MGLDSMAVRNVIYVIAIGVTSWLAIKLFFEEKTEEFNPGMFGLLFHPCINMDVLGTHIYQYKGIPAIFAYGLEYK